MRGDDAGRSNELFLREASFGVLSVLFLFTISSFE